MQCREVRDQLVALLSAGTDPWPEPLERHLEGCAGCRGELEALSQTWALLDRWPETLPGEAIKARLVRRVRRQLLRESVLTASGWTRAVLAAVIGVGLSLGLSLLIPYSLLISLCRQALQVSDPHGAPFLLGGMVYGVPLGLSVWILSRQALGTVIGSLEASLLFLVILAPYVIAQCREFALPLQVAFISGLGGGAVFSSLAGLWLSRIASFGKIHDRLPSSGPRS